MRFFGKYLIRWGIVGWVVTFGFGLYFYFTFDFGQDWPGDMIHRSVDVWMVLFSFAVISIPLGYLLQQVYITFAFYGKGKKRNLLNDILIHYKSFERPSHWWDISLKERCFRIEYEWHACLLKLKDGQREYIVDRYRYLLDMKHSLGVLRLSLGLTLIFLSLYQVFYLQFQYSWPFAIYFIILLFLFISSWLNYNYYAKNLNIFQGKFLEVIKDNSNKDKSDQ